MHRIEPRTVVTLARALRALHSSGIPEQKALTVARKAAAVAAGRIPEDVTLQQASAAAAELSIRRNRAQMALSKVLCSLDGIELYGGGQVYLVGRLQHLFQMAGDFRKPLPSGLKAQLASLPFTREFLAYANATVRGIWLPDWHTGPITSAAPPPPVSFNDVYRKLELIPSLTFDEKELLRDALVARRFAMGSPSVPRRTA